MAANELKGASVFFDFPSVGATENTMMAACFANGETIMENAAREPEIVDLANFLNACGARISGAGTERIQISGINGLKAVDYQVMPDRIEAGTFILLSCITNSSLEIVNCPVTELEYFLDRLRECGNKFEMIAPQHLLVKPCENPSPLQIITRPHPGFPTDLQAQMISYLTMANGTSLITETIFENRFLHVAELNRMGADIRAEGSRAVIHGPTRLSGAEIMASDIRAGAAILIAALAAQGSSEISRIYHIDRGYEHPEQKLLQIGARIRRVSA
jgi:UDP-N-acetylglucosamine 1-carboxyvinyltransferase